MSSSANNSKRKRATVNKTAPAAATRKVARMTTEEETDNTGAEQAANGAGTLPGVVILPTPIKSESDKKSYR